MIFRQARSGEIEELFKQGYKVWSRNRTFAKYCEDNSREDVYGTRYVLEEDGEIISSLILLKLKDYGDRKVYGIGSVLTPDRHSGKGYATRLLENCMGTVEKNAIIFLYSDIRPEFYARFGFRAMPTCFQKKANSVCMVRCGEEVWKELHEVAGTRIPDYF